MTTCSPPSLLPPNFSSYYRNEYDHKEITLRNEKEDDSQDKFEVTRNAENPDIIEVKEQDEKTKKPKRKKSKFNKMTVSVLRNYCRKHGLDHSGKKSELIERITSTKTQEA